MTAPVSDEELVAFLHGELEEVRAAEVEAAINADPSLAERAEALDRQDELLRAAFAPILAAPLPEGIAGAIESPAEPAASRVVSLADARAARDEKRERVGRGWGWPQFGAMAASLALGIFAGPQLIGGDAGDPAGSLVVAGTSGATAPAALAAMLDEAASAERVELAGLGTATVDITFRNLDGQPCRQLRIDGDGGTSDMLACRRDGDWRIEAFGQRAEAGGEMRTASGEAAPAVLAAADAMIDGDPLVGDEERAALAR